MFLVFIRKSIYIYILISIQDNTIIKSKRKFILCIEMATFVAFQM